MSGGVADDGALDYARIQMIPSENRYEAFVCYGNEVDGLAEGNLDTLLLHLPELQELNSKGSKASIKLQPSASSGGTTWFTKSTLRRFLQIVGSPELPNIMKTMNEMSQLEETKRFHLSLYGQGQMSKTEEKDGCNLDSSSPKHGVHMVHIILIPSFKKAMIMLQFRQIKLAGLSFPYLLLGAANRKTVARGAFILG